MNMFVPQEAERRVQHSAFDKACYQASGTRPFCFGTASRHKCLEAGRYLMLMRQYHGKDRPRRSGRFPLLAIS
jgi:hypothetical protein